MSEAEKQEGQKTVVAFITGLLVGGLLVWVFSSTPENAPQTENEEVTTEESANTDQTNQAPAQNETISSNVSADGKGVLAVTSKKAGDTVSLSSVTYPDKNGWVVVRDYTDNVAGRILGAARYSTDEGLTPNSVGLLRNTEAGKTYQVLFYTESGDKKFSTADDVAVESGATTFQAE